MFYYISVIVITLLPTGEPIKEHSVTGPFPDIVNCMNYANAINQIAIEANTRISKSECKEKVKGEAV
jgi:hypothetical protein